jgi:hypothetical protein
MAENKIWFRLHMDGNEQKYIQEALTLIDCANRDKFNYFLSKI